MQILLVMRKRKSMQRIVRFYGGYIDEYNEEWVECSPELIKFLISAYEAGYGRDNFISEDECKQYIATLKGILDGYDTNNNFIRIEYV